MVPHIAAKTVDPDGRTVSTVKPKLYHRVMSAHTAADVNQMMRTVVDEGTGQPAQLGGGVQFAGKTGTASVGPTGELETQPWFIGFAPANDPKIAVAVLVENGGGRSLEATGGSRAAPIGRAVIAAGLRSGG